MVSSSQQLTENHPGVWARLGHHKTILVVEDDGFVRQATCELLTNSGHFAVAAKDAATARSDFSRDSTRIDVIICDAILPDASGIELCRLFQEQRPELDVILTSGYPPHPNALGQRSRSYFLEKPYSGDSLLAAVERVLKSEVRLEGPLPPIAERLQDVSG